MSTRVRTLGGRDDRIARAFERAGAEKRAAFVPFLVAGDPDLALSRERFIALAELGSDLLEIGVPFSDPIADGPVIQAAAQRALEARVHLAEILGMVADLRRSGVSIPVVLFSYSNPIFRYGPERFAEHAAASGVDGVLVVDLPPEEAAGEYLDALAPRDLAPIFLLAPTSSGARVREVRRRARGFVYYVSRTGTTGRGLALRRELRREVRSVKRAVRLPVVLGFGVSEPGDVERAAAVADGVVVGSALIEAAQQGGTGRMLELASDMLQRTRR